MGHHHVTSADIALNGDHLDNSKVAKVKPRPMIGPINGETSIAPMMTAGDDSSRPSMAIPADIAVMNA